jgi:hypothetical protein
MSRVPSAAAVAGVFFAQALILLVLVHFAPPLLVFALGPLAGAVGAVACFIAGRVKFVKPASEEPWLLNAWSSLVAGCAVLALGFSVGAEAAATAWLLAALHVALGTMAIAGRA